MIIYVDGSASTNDEGVHEALMDAAEAYLDEDNPGAVEMYAFNHDEVWPIRQRSDQKLHFGGAHMGCVIEHAAGRDCIVITEDKFLHKMTANFGGTPDNMVFEVVPAGFMHQPHPAPIKAVWSASNTAKPAKIVELYGKQGWGKTASAGVQPIFVNMENDMDKLKAAILGTKDAWGEYDEPFAKKIHETAAHLNQYKPPNPGVDHDFDPFTDYSDNLDEFDDYVDTSDDYEEEWLL